MKRDKYVADVLKVIAQAKTEHELELMRQALIEGRAVVENKAYTIKQEAFREKCGSKYWK